MPNRHWLHRTGPYFLALAVLLAAAPAAHAGTGGADLPWNAPLQTVTDNLTGPTAKTIAALAFVLGGAMWMFTRHPQSLSNAIRRDPILSVSFMEITLS